MQSFTLLAFHYGEQLSFRRSVSIHLRLMIRCNTFSLAFPFGDLVYKLRVAAVAKFPGLMAHKSTIGNRIFLPFPREWCSVPWSCLKIPFPFSIWFATQVIGMATCRSSPFYELVPYPIIMGEVIPQYREALAHTNGEEI